MSFTWQALPIGAGGNLTGLSIANDNTMVVRTDTYGAYLWNATGTSVATSTGAWIQLLSPTSMSSFANATSNYNTLHDGCQEIQIAAANSQIMYMMYDVNSGSNTHAVWKSVNQGSTWTALPTLSGTSYFSFNPNYGAPSKHWGPKLSISPTDTSATTVYVGAPGTGLFKSADGGTTWAAMSVPVSTNSGYVVNVSGFSSNQAFAYSAGTGIYLTQNGGTAWTQINSSTGATSVVNAQIDPNTGNYFCADGTNAWRYIIGTGWTEIYTASGGFNAQDVAVDPNIAVGGASSHIVIGDGNGNMNESVNNGTTFGGWATANNPASSTGDIAWLNLFAANDQQLFFDRTVAKKLNAVTNRGFFTATYSGTLTTASPLTWFSQARGVEQMVGNCVVVPVTGTPVIGVWDSGLVRQPSFTSYPTASEFFPGTLSGISGVIAGWTIDYASTNTSFMVAVLNGGNGADTNPSDSSAYSINGGISWTSFTSIPPGASGKIAAIAAQSASNMVWFPKSAQPYFTNNGGSTWSAVSVSGIVSFTGYNVIGTLVAADRVSASTFYMFLPTTGFYSSTDGGSSFAQIASYTTGIFNGAKIKTVPGVAGDFWMGGGGNNMIHYFGGNLYSIQPYPYNTIAFGFGKNTSGSYPSVYYAGGGPTGAFGIWQCNTASSATGTSTVWNQVSEWPNNSFDYVNDLSGDPGIYNQIYVVFAGSTAAYYGQAGTGAAAITYGLIQLRR